VIQVTIENRLKKLEQFNRQKAAGPTNVYMIFDNPEGDGRCICRDNDELFNGPVEDAERFLEVLRLKEPDSVYVSVIGDKEYAQ